MLDKEEMDYIDEDETDFYHLIREGKATIEDFYAWNDRVWAEMFNNVEKIPDDFEINATIKLPNFESIPELQLRHLVKIKKKSS